MSLKLEEYLNNFLEYIRVVLSFKDGNYSFKHEVKIRLIRTAYRQYKLAHESEVVISKSSSHFFMNDCFDVSQQICIVSLADFFPFLLVLLELYAFNVFVSLDIFENMQDEGLDDEYQANKVSLFQFNFWSIMIVWLTEKNCE